THRQPPLPASLPKPPVACTPVQKTTCNACKTPLPACRPSSTTSSPSPASSAPHNPSSPSTSVLSPAKFWATSNCASNKPAPKSTSANSPPSTPTPCKCANSCKTSSPTPSNFNRPPTPGATRPKRLERRARKALNSQLSTLNSTVAPMLMGTSPPSTSPPNSSTN